MKRVDMLFDKICSIDNLWIAESNARKGKSNTYGVKLFDKDKAENLVRLRELLVTGKFKTSNYTKFTIFEPKERLIYRLPYYPDRIVHHAVMNILEPIWVKLFIKNTYSCIKGRGIHAAVNDIKRDLRNDVNGTRYCLKIDIKKFYPSIDHDVLKNIIRKKIKDARLLDLLDGIIDSAEGVPIGNYLSQYFANLYLTYFDHWMKEVICAKYYYRYADDIVVLSDSKEWLHDTYLRMKKYVEDNLNLMIKGNWQIYPVESRGIDFLGYVFHHTYTRMRKSIKNNMFKKAVKYAHYNEDIKNKRMRISSYNGWMKYCNSKNLKVKLNKLYNYEIFT